MSNKLNDLLEDSPAVQQFPWLVRPADAVPLNDIGQIKEQANQYFEFCAANGIRPRLMGLALALGVEGPVSLQRMAMRRPELRYILSRCLAAVAYGYEEDIESGASQGAIFMLKHIPEFDSYESPVGVKPIQYFSDRREVNVNTRVAGVRTLEHEGSDLSPEEVYFNLIHGHGEIEEAVYEDVPPNEQPKLESLAQIIAETDDEDPTET